MRTFAFVVMASALLAPSRALAGNDPASPVVVEGIVPDDATRAALLGRLRAIYGQERLVDRLEVAPVTAPANWSRYVVQAISDDLRQISKGTLSVEGNSVVMRGQVKDADSRERLRGRVKAAFNETYELTSELVVREEGSSQQVLDRTLANRTVQFESGSAVLTGEGRAVLDDMAAAIARIGTPHLDVVGHTDSVGDRSANILLSVQRADVAKAYLALRGVPADHMIASGRGPDMPLTENETSPGRARNRRIEFVIRRQGKES